VPSFGRAGPEQYSMPSMRCGDLTRQLRLTRLVCVLHPASHSLARERFVQCMHLDSPEVPVVLNLGCH
jgi:hypothetical protein